MIEKIGYIGSHDGQLDLLSLHEQDLAQNPLLEGIVERVEAAMDTMTRTSDFFVKNRKGIDQKTKKQDQRYDLYGQGVATTATDLYIRTDQSLNSLDFARQVLGDYIDKDVIRQQKYDSKLSETIDAYTTQKHNLDEIGEEVSNNLNELSAGDAYLGCQVLKELAAPIILSEGEKTIFNQQLAFLLTIDHVRSDRQYASVIDSLLSQLDSGRFDTILADEMLQTIQNNDNDPQLQSRKLNMHSMLGLLMTTGASEQEASQYLRSQAGIDSWGSRLSAVLENVKRDYASNMLTKVNQRRSLLEEAGFIIPKGAGENFEAEIRKYINSLRVVHHINVGKSDRRLTKAQVVAINADARRQTRGYNGNGKPTVTQAARESPLLRATPRELGFINGQGQVYQLIPGEVAACVEDYVKKHGGNQELIGQINDLLETLRLVDLSKQINKGLAPHDRDVKINGVNVGTFWEIRPDKLIGSYKLSAQLKKLRIFGNLDDGHLAIHKIIDKREVPAYKRGLGIVSAPRRNK